ncbi:diaminobutyrate--2-oxoglutarate transaminase family protein [Massilia antarctica]|uniref:diaminobutyrate--2-oxoglutarate transaminase family protein n=1 Tax=Massilia antarctica TaxID=2765360 RepID=UPI0022714AB6|nr:diaminobutyrate--2-oxoglutarate transaminase family protein [Massilia sp. H27-R4]MCY0915972.1 diaminobutyrate--2-oxoglutarate transaminase family protein [Massilia sp. H27-R4]
MNRATDEFLRHAKPDRITLSDAGNYQFPTNPALTNQENLESEVRSYPRRFPIAIKRAQGALVEDTNGQSYLDCLSGAGALPLGHNHPEVVKEIIDHIRADLPFQTLDVTTPVKDAFIREVMAFLPQSFAANACIQFCGPSGSDAVEAALKLAKQVTGRSNIISFHGAYHGMTNGSLALMGNLNAKTRRSGLMPDVHFFPYPYDLRCKFGLGGEAGERASIRYIESVLHDQESGIVRPAAIILEPIQGEGGVIAASAYWLRELRRITSELGILLIFDEIQCGIGRSGRNFAFEYAGIDPDILIMSKAVGGGLPLSCLVFKKEFDTWNPGEHAGTFRGNQLAMVAGAKTLQIIGRDELAANANRMGERLSTQLRALQDVHPCIAEIRGKGLMLGIEIVCPGQHDVLGHPLANPELASQIQRAALKNGLIIEKGGRHGAVLRFLPPLNITSEQIDFAGQAFGRALAACTKVGNE